MKTLVKIALIAISLSGLSASLSSHALDLKGKAKDFTLKSNSGRNIRLSEMRGKVVMINFWAHWCGPCRQEMPHLEKIYQRYKDAGFTILGVHQDSDPKTADKVLNDIPVSFPILYDTTSKVSETYNVSAMPSTVFIDCDGNLKYLHRGYKPGEEKTYQKYIKSLIKACSI
ncbi:MAG: TlpA family protein disulfide reductase [Cellvibrionaceae bacterium]|nr:TlpA family protein disulfide reductase [Cellvibrionaceae bacterium]